MNLEDLVATAGVELQVQRLLEAAGAPGASIALIFDGQPWSAGVGHAMREGADRLDPSARFSIYSVTKTVIAAIVMKLAESGMLLLHDPIGAHVTGLPFEAPVSIRQALNHTGGFPDYGGLADYTMQSAIIRIPPGRRGSFWSERPAAGCSSLPARVGAIPTSATCCCA